MNPIIKVIIPAHNEQDSIENVINDIPNIVDEIIVISNNSNDNTEINAKKAGAAKLPEFIRNTMKITSKIMTKTAYYF